MAPLNFLLSGLLFTLFVQALATDNEVPVRIDEMNDPNALYESNRNLFDLFDLGVGSLRAKCSAIVNRPSAVLPNLGVVLTRLANNRLYFFAQPPAPGVNFATARQFCAEHGMHLVTINSDTENSLVLARAVALGLAGPGAAIGAWIGLRDVGINSFRWVQDNSPTAFQFFAANFPVTGQCAAYIGGAAIPNPALAWNTADCALANRNFICELEPPCSTVLLANNV